MPGLSTGQVRIRRKNERILLRRREKSDSSSPVFSKGNGTGATSNPHGNCLLLLRPAKSAGKIKKNKNTTTPNFICKELLNNLSSLNKGPAP